MKLVKMKYAAVAFLSAATLALSACATDASSFAGSWGENQPGEPSLTIDDDGVFDGTDGCNSLVGTGTADGATFDFGKVAGTLMACQDVDEWLRDMASATVSGDTLTIFNKDGEKIGTLDRR